MEARWRQTLQDVDVTIPVPKGTRGRDLQVELKKKYIKVALKGQTPLIEASSWCLSMRFPSRSHYSCIGRIMQRNQGG